MDLEDTLVEDKFDNSEPYNEQEEDIDQLSTLDLSEMAITGTDWTAETIVNQIRKGNILLSPYFQRRDAWNIKIKSRFIESLFLGLPIPQIILAERKEKKGSYIVIDGKQRLLSLQQFVGGDESGRKLKLTGLEVKTSFNKMTYDDIQNSEFCDEIDAFNNQTIRTVVIKNWPTEKVLYLLFLRLNTGSVKLSPQELRQALYPGPFIDFVNNVSETCPELYQMLDLKRPDFRMRDVEILIRFFSFSLFADKYSGSMQQFLDNCCDVLNKSWNSKSEDIKNLFSQFVSAIQATIKIFGDDAFHKFKAKKYESKMNRAIMDIMLYYFARPDVRIKALENKQEIKLAFESLCTESVDFVNSIENTTKSMQSVTERFNAWADVLSKVLEMPIQSPYRKA